MTMTLDTPVSLRPLLLVDLDDTLTGVQLGERVGMNYEAYEDAIERFGHAMARFGFDRHQAISLHDVLDQELARKHGFGDKTRFAESMVLTYRRLNESYQDEEQEAYLHSIGMSVFTDYPYRALPGALDFLALASTAYDIAIVTKGSPDEQNRKIIETGVERFAQHIFVVERKDDEDWDAVLEHLDLPPELIGDSWAIGNSLKADVNPLLRRGFNGLFLFDPHGWSFEHDVPYTDGPGIFVQRSVIADAADVLPLLASNHSDPTDTTGTYDR